jgi:NitT/TauT family transport system ATP-binding protein
LNLLSGLAAPQEGAVEIPPELRRAFVFQDFPLFPWRTVMENVHIARELDGPPPASFTFSLEKLIEEAGLSEWSGALPNALSGGMRQRVCLLQALASEPDLLLLDEPFSALDFESKIGMQRLIGRWSEAKPRTTILVTHDISDAVAMSDTAVIMAGRPGQVQDSIDFGFGAETIDPVDRRRTQEFHEAVNLLMDRLKW